jgi:hypothetical protein
LYEKYKTIHQYIDKLEPSVITMMYKEFKQENTFYPNIGVFFNEFALVYSANLNSKKHET